jgi:hydroxymethylpyrimidine pyrophosphatase-like HAD family hydrolase
MDRATEGADPLIARLDVRIVYADLDGTLLGPGGSLFAGPDGAVTPEPAAALAALGAAGIDLMLMSGRTATQVREVARLLGAAGSIVELGGLVVHREGRQEVIARNVGSFRGRGTPFEAMERSGVGGLLMEAFPGRVEPHAPWAFLPRETSMLLRGSVDLAEAAAVLAEAGFGWLDLQDNGVIPSWPGRFPALDPAIEEVHAYHLVPAGVSKRAGVALDRDRRGLAPGQCVAVGDSAADADVAPEVGAVFLVANARAAVRGRTLAPNVHMTERTHGLGFAEAVLPFTRRGGHERG